MSTGDAGGRGSPPVLVRVLQQAPAQYTKLAVVQKLLASALQSARVVVKGTDSQRSFSVQFSDFCRTSLLAMAELEDASFELANPGRRASDASDEEVQGIAESDFIKEVSRYIAAESGTLGVQYLEHVGLQAATKHTQQLQRQQQQQQQRKRERPMQQQQLGGSQQGVDTTAPASKKGRLAKTQQQQRQVPQVEGEQLGMEPLGLLEEAELTRRALAGAQQQHQQGKGWRTVVPQVGFASSFPLMQEGMFVSVGGKSGKGAAAANVVVVGPNVTGKVIDLRDPVVKLSSIPELTTLVQPWTLPNPLATSGGGITIDRVAAEKEKRPSMTDDNHTATAASTGEGGGGGGPSSACSVAGQPPSVYEVCLSATPAELLKAWETREGALHGPSSATSSGQVISRVPPRPDSADGGAKRKRKSSPPRTGQVSPQDSPLAISKPVGSADGDSVSLIDAAAGCTGGGSAQRAFFPYLSTRYTTCVPTYVMHGLVQYGVPQLEFPYRDY